MKTDSVLRRKNGWLTLVPERGSTLTQKWVALSRRSNRRRRQKAYHEWSGMLTTEGRVDAIEIRPRMADGRPMRIARAGCRREIRALVLCQDARFLDYGGKSLRVPRRRRR